MGLEMGTKGLGQGCGLRDVIDGIQERVLRVPEVYVEKERKQTNCATSEFKIL